MVDGGVSPETWTTHAFQHLVVGRSLARTMPDGAPSNCLLWAFQQQAKDGGDVILTQSEYGPWLHARWQRPDGRVFEFVPTGPKVRHATPPPLFEGVIQEWEAR